MKRIMLCIILCMVIFLAGCQNADPQQSEQAQETAAPMPVFALVVKDTVNPYIAGDVQRISKGLRGNRRNAGDRRPRRR
ncbi:MAG TPA: hypothetical protein PK537_05470, partial [Candidatus Limiplasma sp.]|nr:hypothetical protein [Candidatus Limiplasma sp.]